MTTDLEKFFEYLSSQQPAAPIEEPAEKSAADPMLFLKEFFKDSIKEEVKQQLKPADDAPHAKPTIVTSSKKEKVAPAVKAKDGRTPILRKSEDAIEWKYTNEKEWRVLVPLSELKAPESDRNFDNNMSQLLGGGGHGPIPEFQVTDNTLYWKLSNDDDWVELITTSGGVTPEEDIMRTKRIDMVDDFVYTGEAAVGTLDADPLWRISRTYIAPTDGDVTVLWANGDAEFDKAWTDHLILGYS